MNKMNLPKVVADLIQAQDNFDIVAYGTCFTEEPKLLMRVKPITKKKKKKTGQGKQVMNIKQRLNTIPMIRNNKF